MAGLKNTRHSTLGIILRRAEKMCRAVGRNLPPDAERILRRANEVIPMRMAEMAQGPDDHLAHDVFGLIRHFDARTGTLRTFWTPRYAKHGIDALIAADRHAPARLSRDPSRRT